MTRLSSRRRMGKTPDPKGAPSRLVSPLPAARVQFLRHFGPRDLVDINDLARLSAYHPNPERLDRASDFRRRCGRQIGNQSCFMTNDHVKRL